ncbi:VOC family protein [Nocardia bovistercoris]|uniref:Glyoxalase n=1 Tax=Nocardia bovistercoris TaxID=2785916 RepID=A0A931N6M9_9NOCA|nr:VOC family protein [Nocardia bovistercoris]MBH0779858.1 glyoxalase [Nocardia bovistercoris]
MGDSPVPVLWTTAPDTALDFYRTLGYTVTHEQTTPYVYLAFERNGCPIHITEAPHSLPAPVEHVAALVMVEDVAAAHREFSTALRTLHGRVTTEGHPRITRFRTGQSRFSLVDPDGNELVFIQPDIPENVEYGGASELDDLARVLDNARILRDFKNDDKAAARVLEVGLGRFALLASPTERGLALAMLAELAVATDDLDGAQRYRARITELELDEAGRAKVDEELRAGIALQEWLRPVAEPRE